MPAIQLDACVNLVKTHNGREMALDSFDLTPFAAKRVRGVFHQVIKVYVRVRHKMCQPHQIPKLNPPSKIPLVSSLERQRKSVADDAEAKTQEYRRLPAVPRPLSCKITPNRSAHRRGWTRERSQLEIPSVFMFITPDTLSIAHKTNPSRLTQAKHAQQAHQCSRTGFRPTSTHVNPMHGRLMSPRTKARSPSATEVSPEG